MNEVNITRLPPAYHEPATLWEYAARVAMDQLLSNWECAVADGEEMNVLLTDVDVVCATLKEWKGALS